MERLIIVSIFFLFLLSCASFPHRAPLSPSIPPSNMPIPSARIENPLEKLLPDEVLENFPEEAKTLGVDGRFWTKRAALWRAFRKTIEVDASSRIVLLKKIFEPSTESMEKFWAAYFLHRVYGDASVVDASFFWLNEAIHQSASPVLQLQKAWILTFEMGKVEEGRDAFSSVARVSFEGKYFDRWCFLRRELQFQKVDLQTWGLDNHVSDLETDHDDLWISTWNGGLARWSLLGNEFKVFLKPGSQISPVRLIRVSRWFVYVFRDNLLQRYSKVTDNWREFPYPDNWSGLRVQDVLLTGDETFWVAHLGRGFWGWNAGNWVDKSPEVPSLFLNSVTKEQDGTFLIGSQDHGLFRWNPEDSTSQDVGSDQGPENITFVVPLPSSSSSKRAWAVGTFGEGLWLLTGDKLQRVSEAENYVTAGRWDGHRFWWGTLDFGLLGGWGETRQMIDVHHGVPIGDVSALAILQKKVICGTPDAGLAIWTDYED